MVDHLKLRVVSFAYGLVSLVASALVGMVLSPEFMVLVTTNFGDMAGGSLAVLLLDGVIKHFRNKMKEGEFGSMDDDEVYV